MLLMVGGGGVEEGRGVSIVVGAMCAQPFAKSPEKMVTFYKYYQCVVPHYCFSAAAVGSIGRFSEAGLLE